MGEDGYGECMEHIIRLIRDWKTGDNGVAQNGKNGVPRIGCVR